MFLTTQHLSRKVLGEALVAQAMLANNSFMKFILGTKQYMTQVFDEDGKVHPATIVAAGPLVVTQLKTMEKDGYKAFQVGFGVRNKKNINEAQQGQFKDKGDFRYIREFRSKKEDDTTAAKEGDSIDVSVFKVGDIIEVSAISKGKGFQGVVKRHGFHGGPRSHGQKHSERAPGSIGATGPNRVFKGKKMAGRMGGDRVTVKNLRVLQIDTEEGRLVISGAIPGRRGTLVAIKGI